MKILFVQKEGGIFGAENYQLKIIPALMRNGFQIEFLRLYTDYQGGRGGKFVETLTAYGVRVYELNIGRFLNPMNLKKINRIVKDGGYDLVHTHLIHADLHLALVKLLFNRRLKLVSTKHGYDNTFTAKHGFDPDKQTLTPYFVISRFAERMMNRSFTITRALHNFFLKTGLSSPGKMAMIYYGFDFEEPKPEWSTPAYRVFERQLIIAGRLVEFKGHRYVLEAFPAVAQIFPDAGIVIAGSGPLDEQLKRQAESLGIADRVRFIGYSSQVPHWMYNSDVVMVPSISEGFGVVLLEAFSVYKPVIAFDVPACNELIQHGETGYLTAPYSTAKMADSIIEVLKNRDHGQTVGQNANRRLKSYFNLERMVQETIAFYHQVN